MPKASAHRVSLLWSAALGISMILILVGVGVIIFNIASPTPVDISLSPSGGLKFKAQSAGPLILAVGAGLLVCLAKLLPNKVQVLSEAPANPAPERTIYTTRVYLTRLGYIGLVAGLILLSWNLLRT